MFPLAHGAHGVTVLCHWSRAAVLVVVVRSMDGNNGRKKSGTIGSSSAAIKLFALQNVVKNVRSMAPDRQMLGSNYYR